MSEGNWMIFTGNLMFPLAILAFKKPELFMKGRRSAGFWVTKIGEEKTKILIRYLGVPLTCLFGIYLIVSGFSER